MAKAEARKNTRAYHSLVAVLLLICGVGLLGVGIWLRYTDRGDFLDLDFSGTSNGAIESISSTDIGAILIGAFLIVCGVFSLIALARNCVGYTFRIIYVLLALVIFVILLGIFVASVIFLARRKDENVRDFFRNAWENGVGNDISNLNVSLDSIDLGSLSVDLVPKSQAVLCSIENTFKCRGFQDNDCTQCATGSVFTEPGCLLETNQRCALCATIENTTISEQNYVGTGCYDDIIGTLNNVFLPTSIVSGILAVIVLVDIFFTCCL